MRDIYCDFRACVLALSSRRRSSKFPTPTTTMQVECDFTNAPKSSPHRRSAAGTIACEHAPFPSQSMQRRYFMPERKQTSKKKKDISRGRSKSSQKPEQWGLCAYVILHTILPPSPVILWISLGGKPKWLPLNFGYHDVMRTGPIKIFIKFISFEVTRNPLHPPPGKARKFALQATTVRLVFICKRPTCLKCDVGHNPSFPNLNEFLFVSLGF